MAEEGEFQDWQTEAEKITQQIITNPVPPVIETTEQPQEQPIDSKQKTKPIDVKKILQDKIKRYKEITQDNYEQYFEEIRKESTNVQIKASNQILKNDKDFVMFGKLAAKKFIEYATDKQIDTLEENQLLSFIDQTIFLLYNQLESKNLHLVKDKLIIAKGQRKKVEKEEKKKQQAEQRRKRQQKAQQQKNKRQKKPEDDFFGGAELITSKQLQDQRKNKQVKAVQVSKKQESDDDDFM